LNEKKAAGGLKDRDGQEQGTELNEVHRMSAGEGRDSLFRNRWS